MLKRKMLRDLRIQKISFLAIFLMTFLGMFVYSGLNSEWNGLRVSTQEYYEETNLADAWLMGGTYTDESLKAMQSDSVTFESRLYLPVHPTADASVNLDLYALNTDDISKFITDQGLPYESSQDGIWLDARYAEAHDLHTGDLFSLNFQNISIEKEIAGLVHSPEYIFSASEGQMMPDHTKNGYAYISKTNVPLLDQVSDNQLLLKTEKTKNELSEWMETQKQLKGSTLVMRSEHSSAAMVDNEVDQHKAMSEIFPVAFLLIGFLTTITTMSRLTMDQRTQIGILQALGFPYRKILFHYISHGFVICSLGCILGYLSGPLLFPMLVYPLLTPMYDLPGLHSVPLKEGYVLLLLCLVLAFAVSWGTCRKQLNSKPAETLRPAERHIKEIPLLQHFQNSIHLSFSSRWNLRDIWRNKLRSFMTVCGILGCSALIFCASGLYDTMKGLTAWMYEDLAVYETKIILKNDVPEEQIAYIQKEVNGESLYEGMVELQYHGTRKTGNLTVQESTQFLKLQNNHRENLTLPEDGICISKKVADNLHVHEGDDIAWRLYGEDTWYSAKIRSIIRTPVAQGITMSASYYRNFHDWKPQSIVTNETAVPAYEGISSITEKTALMHDLDSMMEALNTMVAILLLAAVLLGGVVLYNLGTLSFLERQRELATLKVLGFSAKKLKHLVFQQNSWLTILGILLGIPAGYGLICIMINTIGDSMDMLIELSLRTYLFTIAGTYTVSLIITLCLSRKLRTIDMVSALKSTE